MVARLVFNICQFCKFDVKNVPTILNFFLELCNPVNKRIAFYRWPKVPIKTWQKVFVPQGKKCNFVNLPLKVKKIKQLLQRLHCIWKSENSNCVWIVIDIVIYLEIDLLCLRLLNNVWFNVIIVRDIFQ